jgi:CDP-diglyceride synthetase
MNDKLKPAMIGGVVIGLLSIIPIVNLGNVCCCLWAILGGLLATYLYVKNSPVPASAGDGAILGAIAGAVGAVIVIILGIPISIIAGGITRELLIRLMESVNPAQAEMVRAQMVAGESIAGAIVNGIILAVCVVIFSTLGGLIGVPIFEKRKRDTVMPPPPQY